MDNGGPVQVRFRIDGPTAWGGLSFQIEKMNNWSSRISSAVHRTRASCLDIDRRKWIGLGNVAPWRAKQR